MFSSANSNRHSDNFAPAASNPAVHAISRDSEFWNAVSQATERAGYKILFEIPGAIFSDDKRIDVDSKAAVLSSRNSHIGENKNDTLFVIFNAEEGIVHILEDFEVPQSIRAFADSYSQLFEYLIKYPASGEASSH